MRTIILLSKSEVQNDREDLIVRRFNNASYVLIKMTSAYSGIEQVRSELEAKEGEDRRER
jgi:hypothetical protein